MTSPSSATRVKLTDVDNGICLPLKLLLNFSLFQYIVTTFASRRRENRVRLLLGVAAMSFASLVPFALPGRKELSRNLNALSEVCSLLTFLLQIVILTRDVSKRLKIRQVILLMRCAELLVLLSLSVLTVNLIDLFAPLVDMAIVELLDSIVQHVALVFVTGFRFYFLSLAKGFKNVLRTQKAEIVAYSLFTTHEVPFTLLHHVTNVDWHHVQGLWLRLTIALCLSLTVRARLASHHSSKKINDTTAYHAGPMKSQLDKTDVHKYSEPIMSTLTHSPVAIVPTPPQKTRAKP